MKKVIRYSLIISLSLLVISLVGYASFLLYEIKNSEIEVKDNTYDIKLYKSNELIKEYNDLEEDSYFDLPKLSYDKSIFKGWSLNSDRNSSISKIDKISIKYLKETYPNDFAIDNNILYLYDVSYQFDNNHTLLNILDNTDSPNSTYYLLTESISKFNLFNIKYVFKSTFVNLSINNVIYGINDMFDLSTYGGKELTVLVNKN